MTPITLVEWIAAVEVAAALVSVLPARAEATIRALRRAAGVYDGPLCQRWLYGRLSRATDKVELAALRKICGVGARIDPPPSLIRPQVALACELLWIRRYPHVETTVDLLRRAAGLHLLPGQVELAWSIGASGAQSAAQALAEFLETIAAHKRDDASRGAVLELGLGMLQRVYCWPLFHRRGAGASFPLHVRTCCDDGGTTELVVGGATSALPCALPAVGSDPGTLTESLALAALAAKETWRAKHGRVEVAFRRRIDLCSVTFDASLLASTMRRLAASEVFDAIVETKQRSLESQLAQAVLASILQIPAPGLLAATGCLRRAVYESGSQSPGAHDWELFWPGRASEDSPALVEMMLAKLEFAGATGVTRVVVPANVATAFHEVRRSRGIRARRGAAIANVVGVRKLARCVDLCASGPWRPLRLLRSEQLPALAERVAARPLTRGVDRALDELRAALRNSTRPGLLIRATPEVGAALVLALISEFNRDFLTRSGPRPSQLGSMFFQGSDREPGLACLASLRRAMAGVADGAALREVEDALLQDTQSEIVDAVARRVTSWVDHSYAETEPWQGPEICVFYNVGRLRHDSSSLERAGGMAIDVWRLLLQLPSVVARVADLRHENELGRVRIVVVEAPDVEVPQLSSDWNVLSLVAEPVASGDAEALDVARSEAGGLSSNEAIVAALAMLRVPSSVGVVVSVANVLAAPDAPKLGWSERSEELVEGLRRPPAMESIGRFALDAITREHGFRLFTSRQWLVRLEAHLAAAACLGPWLRLDELLNHPLVRTCRGDIPPLAAESPVTWMAPDTLSQIEIHLLAVRHEAQQFRGRDTGTPTFEGLVMQALELLSLARHHSTPDRVHNMRRFLRDGSTALRAWKAFIARRSRHVFGLPLSVQMVGLSTMLSVLKFSGNLADRELAVRDAETLIEGMRGVIATSDSPALRGFADGTIALASAYVQLHAGRIIDPGDESRVWAAVVGAEGNEASLRPLGEAFEALGDSAYLRGDLPAAARWYATGILHAPDYQQCAVKHSLVSNGPAERVVRQYGMVVASLKKTPSPVAQFREAMGSLITSLPPSVR